MQRTAESFLDYIRPHWTRLYLVARRYCAREHDARDLVQETLFRGWRRFSTSPDATYKRSWLFVIMRNVAFDWQRLSQRRVSLAVISHAELTEIAAPDPTEPLCPLPVMDEGRFREFLDDRIAAALDAVDPAFREVLILSVVGDLTYREIGEVLDCPVGTVMSRMARARRALRERLAGFVRIPGRVSEHRS